MLGLGVAGTIAPWFSYPAILVDAGLFAALGLSAIAERDRERLRPLLPVAIAWAASIAATVAWARATVTPDDALYMQRFWVRSLMPWPPQSLRDLVWPVSRLTTVYAGGGLRYPAPGVFLVLAVLGAWACWRRARDLAWLLLGPIVATFGAAALRVYPFAPRLVLFLFPAFLLLTAAGVEAVGGFAVGAAGSRGGPARRRSRGPRVRRARRHRPRAGSPALRARAAEAGAGGDAGGLAPRRPRLRLLRRGEGVRLLCAALRLRARLVPPGGCAREDPRRYLRELDRFRGAPRVWLVMAHPALGEDAILLDYLDRIGTRRRSYQAMGREPGSREPDRARAELYDLSDPARLDVTADAFPCRRGRRADGPRPGPATADAFPVPPAGRRGGRAAAWSCHPRRR